VHSVGSRKISEQFVSSLLCPWSWLVSEEWVRLLLVFSRPKVLLLEAGTWGSGEFGNLEERERPPLEAANRQRLGRTQKILWVLLLQWFYSNSVRLSYLFVVTCCKRSIFPIIKPNSVYSFTHTSYNTLKWIKCLLAAWYEVIPKVLVPKEVRYYLTSLETIIFCMIQFPRISVFSRCNSYNLTATDTQPSYICGTSFSWSEARSPGATAVRC
jgi:hypothetical protein